MNNYPNDYYKQKIEGIKYEILNSFFSEISSNIARVAPKKRKIFLAAIVWAIGHTINNTIMNTNIIEYKGLIKK